MDKSNKGSVFVFALWTVFFVSVFTFYTARIANMKIEFVHRVQTRMSLHRISNSGINQLSAKIMNISEGKPPMLFSKIVLPSIEEYIIEKDNDIVYKLSYNYKLDINNGTLYIKVSDSQSRLNLNNAKPRSLQRLLQDVAGLDDEKALELSYSIIDWRDKDNERPFLNVINNEDLLYKLAGVNYVPTNKKYKSIEELLLVNGMTVQIYENIKPFITVFGSMGININTCSLEVLNAVIEDEEITQKIYSFRKRSMGLDESVQQFFYKR